MLLTLLRPSGWNHCNNPGGGLWLRLEHGASPEFFCTEVSVYLFLRKKASHFAAMLKKTFPSTVSTEMILNWSLPLWGSTLLLHIAIAVLFSLFSRRPSETSKACVATWGRLEATWSFSSRTAWSKGLFAPLGHCGMIGWRGSSSVSPGPRPQHYGDCNHSWHFIFNWWIFRPLPFLQIFWQRHSEFVNVSPLLL